MGQFIKKEYHEFRLLLQSVPTGITVLFILSVFSMNLLANKSITLPFDWLALDCGILVSWFAFLTMDILTKHFGPKAATELSVFAIFIHLIFCLIFFIGGRVPGMWGEAFVPGNEDLINSALDHTFGGTWYVLAGSAIAMTVSSFVNNFTNWGIGKAFRRHPDGVPAYVCRTYVSTAIGQLVDNLVFALLVSHVFFGWSFFQCVTCAVTGMLAELLCEIIFSGFGYRVCRRWRKNNVGEAYISYMKEKEAHTK